MIDIISHIRELLFKHDCVILPAFGGFIGNYRPAQIDKNTSTFSPPVKAISFNRNLVHNDGLLIGKISAERKIGYADSKRIVEDFIDGVKRGLEKGERVVFDRIGYFQINKEGNIEFEPDGDVNFLLDSYGLTSFRREPLMTYELSGRKAMRDMDPVRSSNRKMAWRAVIAVPFIAAMILVPLKTDLLKSKVSLNPISGIELPDSELVEKNKVIISREASENSEEQPATDEAGSNLSPANAESPVLQPVQDDLIEKYYIVTGSFKSRENGLRMVNEASSKGYNAELSENENGFYRVLLNSYSTKDDAIKLRDKVRSDYSDCWILKK